ncbi:class I SAM-dependent methyltransferase [Bdellovibrio sp. HCB185ZH]|uniref:class I SAM-dependent methyltransferase n=1 Tax=Bdellovibrio sp. HCB185ZH TaxID=3394235 RepID=UPI0039A44F5D
MKHFDVKTAAGYDLDIRSRVPGYDLLQELISAVLDVEVPNSGRMLVVGSGTGEEIVRLSRRYSGWKIDGIEPSSEMNKIAIDRTGPYRSQNQIQFHETQIEDYPIGQSYDVAMSVLVSHFIPDDGSKKTYFEKIHAHLKPGAPLVLIDMMKQTDCVGEKFIANNYFWAKSHGLNIELLRDMPSRMRTMFHPLTQERLKEILSGTGFTFEGQFAQCLGFCGYLIRKPR